MENGNKSSAEFKQELMIYSGFSLTSIFVGVFLMLQDKFDFWASKPLAFFFLCFPMFFLLNFVRVQYLQERARNRFLNGVLLATPAVVFVYDWNKKDVMILNGGLPTLGYSDQEVDDLGSTIFSVIVPQEDLASVIMSIQSAILKTNQEVVTSEWKFKTKDGQIRHFKVNKTALSQSQENPMVIGYAEDITEQIDLQKKLEQDHANMLQMEKYAALGGLGAGVAHEINNPLAVILGRANSIRIKLDRNEFTVDDIKESIGKIETNVKKISKIANALRLMTKEHAEEIKEKVPLVNIFEDVETIWSQRLKNHGFDFVIEKPTQDILINGSRSQLVTALFNLISNSFEVLQHEESKWVKLVAKTSTDLKLEIQVIDSGSGIPKHVRDKIFEPFFTTRSGSGTGLGLSLAKEIMDSHSGTISIDESSPNTKFVLTLPYELEAEHLAA